MRLQPPVKTRKLREALHAKAKGSPRYRFYALYDKVYREDILDYAYRKCAAQGGAPGVDGQSFAEIESYDVDRWLGELAEELRRKEYRPDAVRRVWIPKPNGELRPLGIPTIRDRVVQTAAVVVLEPIFEADLEPEQYAYREGRGALDAVRRVHSLLNTGHTEVVDADLAGYFDTIPHAELMKSVARRISDKWMLRLIKMWLEVPVEEIDERGRKHRSNRARREGRGIPQGAPVSPPLANIFLHLAFDAWMRKTHPGVPFERYADDVVAHCKTERQAMDVRRSIEARLTQCKLQLHPEKTRIVYCKDDDHRGSYPNEKFDFLGYTFRPRRSRNRWGKYFINFSPAASNEAMTRMRRTMRRWRVHLRSDKALDDLARMWNPTLRGWIQYYGHFYPSALYPVFRHLDRTLARWAMRKYKRLRRHRRRATHWLGGVARRDPRLFAHWHLLGIKPAAG